MLSSFSGSVIILLDGHELVHILIFSGRKVLLAIPHEVWLLQEAGIVIFSNQQHMRDAKSGQKSAGGELL